MRINFERLVVELVCSSLITLPFPLHLLIVWFIIRERVQWPFQGWKWRALSVARSRPDATRACAAAAASPPTPDYPTKTPTWAISVRAARAANQACVHHHQLSAEWLDHQTSRLDRCVCVSSVSCATSCAVASTIIGAAYSSSVQASHTDEPNHHAPLFVDPNDVTPSCANLAWYCPRLDGRLDSQHIVS